jgi:DNA-binding NtrC family response regulator
MNSILIIEDDAIMGESLVQRFELEGMQVTWSRRLSDAGAALEKLPSAVVSDVRLPDGLATEWFVQLSPNLRTIPWFFLTGYGSVNDAINAIKAGAREYLTKPFDIENLVKVVRESIDIAPAEGDDAVLGVSPSMRRVEAMVRKVARQRVSVLLTGESGVGKEVAAQLIHSQDPRSESGDFVAVNCAAIPETMLEAEFFGYEKGAFSGATRTHKGYLERAHRGTLFLDEVGELPASMQAKLLRALQEKCFFRLGAERTVQSDFRILAATNRDLYADMRAGKFREDLFYRLAVIKIELPPLRERVEDIRWLTEKLLADIVIEQGRPLAMSETFLRDVMSREWRGNVRELRSYLEQAVVLSDGGLLDADFSPSQVFNGKPEQDDDEIAPLHSILAKVERVHIKRALLFCEGSVSKTADVLGISRKTLWEKMKKLEISA